MKLLVYGATGSQGRPVAEGLLAAGHELRILTRDLARVTGLEGAGRSFGATWWTR